MLRITRLTDYGIVLLTQFASKAEKSILNARELSTETGIPLPTVSKVLKTLAHSELLETHRGIKGGFHLARPASEITVAEMISSLEGPIAMTECGGHEEGSCEMESLCVVRDKWKKINEAVIAALKDVSLADLTDSGWSPVTLKGDLSEVSGRK